MCDGNILWQACDGILNIAQIACGGLEIEDKCCWIREKNIQEVEMGKGKNDIQLHCLVIECPCMLSNIIQCWD